MGTITSEEINYLVYRYLQESGFVHSAFTFAYEALISKSTIAHQGAEVPPGALIAFLQKGLQLVSLEHHINEDGSERACDEEMSLLTPHVCHTLANQKNLVKKTEVASHLHTSENSQQGNGEHMDTDEHERHPEKQSGRQSFSRNSGGGGNNNTGEGDRPVFEVGESMRQKTSGRMALAHSEFSKSEVSVLSSHSSEVFCCSWNPTNDLLATGSGDATARIWNLQAGEPGGENAQSLELVHQSPARSPYATAADKQLERDVTTLEWSRNGELLATGGMDGIARIWSKEGGLQHTLNAHEESIFSLHFNYTGDLLLTGSYDNSTIAWDVATGQPKHRFEVHSAQVLDVDWKDGKTFASCSTDKTIKICTMDGSDKQPVQTFLGHKDEVNAIKWDPSGNILASCSDDTSAKLWTLGEPNHLHDLREHSKEIYTIRWSPTGLGSQNPNKKLVLASASFDSMVKLWDVERGCCTHSLNRHDKKVYTVAFSPCGDYIASGSLGGQLYVWSIRDGSIVRSFRGGSDIFEVAWNSRGDRIAACGGYESGSSNAVTIIDFRM